MLCSPCAGSHMLRLLELELEHVLSMLRVPEPVHAPCDRDCAPYAQVAERAIALPRPWMLRAMNVMDVMLRMVHIVRCMLRAEVDGRYAPCRGLCVLYPASAGVGGYATLLEVADACDAMLPMIELVLCTLLVPKTVQALWRRWMLCSACWMLCFVCSECWWWILCRLWWMYSATAGPYASFAETVDIMLRILRVLDDMLLVVPLVLCMLGRMKRLRWSQSMLCSVCWSSRFVRRECRSRPMRALWRQWSRCVLCSVYLSFCFVCYEYWRACSC